MAQDPTITKQLIVEHGLTTDEYSALKSIIGRDPSFTELGIFSVMWSEHCSYKSSKKWLKTLPTDGPQVIQGPGENAGVVDIGNGEAAVFKIESHNHPSFIEPYQGAATGVGGILRDVFTMGARPIANLNALRFGAPSHPKTRHLLEGVVSGIGGYGNCIGVPTVGGEIDFHRSYNGNILVNAMTVGLADQKKIFYSAAAGIGNAVVYVGSKTGRDGIHGATMASAEFSSDTQEKRPTVQVGDPFTEKLLLEACLELMSTDAIIAIQDMGAAGLTSSSVEMASKGGVGIELNLDNVPACETEMSAYELMLSESQERMLMVIKPDSETLARKIFAKWELDFAVIGSITDTGRLIISKDKKVHADIPIAPLVENAPEYDRPWEPTKPKPKIDPVKLDPPKDLCEILTKLISCPDMTSKQWVWEQYDHMVMADTIVGPGSDAAVIRIHGSKRGLAVTTDCTPRYCNADPYEGGKQAVSEAWRNITATGAKPLALTNNLNFGNPERPSIMGQLVCCISGIGDAGKALDFPVVSGNVSLYNETNGEAIFPTPVIGGLGLIEDIGLLANLAFQNHDEKIIVIGETTGWLGQSLYLREIEGLEEGAPPPVDLTAERRNGDFIRNLLESGEIKVCHDVSDGGLLVAIAEMAMASGIGATLYPPHSSIPYFSWAFGEDQARYIITVREEKAILAIAQRSKVPAEVIGITGGSTLTLDATTSISVSDLNEHHKSWLQDFMDRN